MMASKGWQHPYVNIFKHVRVDGWKRASKQGDVSTYMDKTLKCPVFRIRGLSPTTNYILDKTLKCPVFRIRGLSPTTNYILVPKSCHQSLGLTGRYFYLLFRPTPGKYFTVHLDVATQEGQMIRISFSNMFQEFKSTDTSLQFPFLCGAAKDSVYEATAKSAKQGLVGPAPAKVRWTCLMLDLRHTLSAYLNRCHSHLKSIRLCSNMLVKNMFTSDLLLDPGISFSEAKLMGLSSLQGTGPIPRDMSFPVPKGNTWHDLYDLIRFPSEGTKLPLDSIQKSSPVLEAALVTDHRTPTRESSSDSLNKPVQDHMSLIPQITSPKPFPVDPSPVVTKLPEPGVFSTQQGDVWFCHNGDQYESESASSHQLISSPPCELDNNGVHIYVHPDEDLCHSGDEVEDEFVYAPVPLPVHASLPEDTKQQKLLPDPILRLSRIIGFGGATAKCALWTKTCDAVVYPCHAVIVSMKISSNEQRFFIGHTDQISALAFNGNTTLLASAQIGNCVVRLWNYHEGNCLALFRIHGRSLNCLSFSYNGGVLCGVGKDLHGKTLVVVWNTQNVTKSGEVTILAKMHSEVDIQTMKITHFDDTRMVSCGRDNIRLWRVRNGTLRSCPVNLGECHSMDFSDVAFEEGDSSFQHLDDRTLYASSRSGHIFEIDYSGVAVKNVRRLFPVQTQHAERREKWTFNTGPGIAINSIGVSSSFVATGSEDGFLRLWPLDFSAVFLEAEHEGAVSLVSISSDSLQVLAATSTGILGFLDVSSRRYNTLMRSHTDTVLGFSVDGIRRHLTTASSDGTVRIWDMDSLHQLYDFVSEDSPSCVAFHPSEQIFSCGFSSGIVRVFDISNAKLLAEHTKHRGEVVGLVFSPNGDCMYSADSQGSLSLYNSSSEEYHVIRTVYNMVVRGTERAPEALTVSSDGHCLAFIGPSEYIVTIADARSLDELLHVDVSTLDAQSPRLNSALRVRFASASTDHLLVATSANKILWVSTKTGRLLRQVSKVHKHPCSSLAVSRDCRFLLTAGHNAVKVWDYNMQLSVNSQQMYIGHSQPITQVSFTPDHLSVVSVGDAIFIWDFLAQPADSDDRLAHSSPLGQSNFSAAISGQTEAVREVQMSIGMPRQSAPLPSSPPTQIVVSPLDQDEHGALRSSPIYDFALTDSSVRVPALLSGPALLSQSRPVPFLKVTQLESDPLLKTNRFDRCKSPDFSCKPLVRPDCYRHFIPRFKTSTVYQDAVVPQPGEEGIKLRAVIGYNGNGRGNMVWSPDQGLFMYSCGCVVVVEYLDTGCQRHLQGHNEEISCLAITNDAKMLASAAGGRNGSTGVICIWDVQTEACRKTLSYHTGAVQSLAFSRDDRFLLSVGDFTDPMVVVWSCKTFQMLHSVNESGPIHDVAFSPFTASQLAYVGSEGVHFCVLHSHGLDIDLKVKRVRLPSAVGDAEVTALCYHTQSLLFTATNGGHVCVWDIETQSCFMTWEADKGEIGVLLCGGNRLLTGSNTHWLRLWEVEGVHRVKPQGKVSSIDTSGSAAVMQQEIMLDGTAISAAFDSTMDMGIVGTTTGTLWYISWSDNSSIRLVSGHKIKVNDVAFSTDESHFATCSEDGSVRVWSASSNELVVQFQVLNQSCGCVCWSPSSAKESACVAAGYSDGTLRIFRLSSSEMEMKLHPHQVAVTAVQYSANGHVILSAGRNGLVVVSSPTDRSTIRVLRDHKGAQITTIQCVNEKCKKFGLEGNEMFLAASSDRRVSVWAADWSKGKCDLLDWLTLPAPAYFEDDSPPPSLAAFCPSDPCLVVYTGYGVGKELSFYSLVKKQIIKKIALPHWATCFSLSPESQLIALGSKEGVLKLIKSTSGRFQDFLQHSDSLQTCNFSPSGKLLFTVAYNEILLWEVKGL